MKTLMDTTAGILTVLAIFVVLALPALIGAAHERRIDRQLGPVRRIKSEGSDGAS